MMTACNATSEFRCRKTNICIAKELRCNARYDCPAGDYTDESDCPCSSDLHLFTCNNGRCVANASRCDGLDDCGDASDEWMCGANVTCGDDDNMYACETGGDVTDVKCIPVEWLCDGEVDCALGDDEKEEIAHCSKTTYTKAHSINTPALDHVFNTPHHMLSRVFLLQITWSSVLHLRVCVEMIRRFASTLLEFATEMPTAQTRVTKACFAVGTIFLLPFTSFHFRCFTTCFRFR